MQKVNKKILIFSLTYFPFVGGAEVAVREITDRVGVYDVEFDMITLRADKKLPKYERIGRVNVYRIGPAKENPTYEELLRFPWYLTKVLYVPLAFLTARRMDKERHYDALWSLMTNMGFPAVFFKFFWRGDVPMVLTLQDGDTISHIKDRLRIKLVYPFFKMIFKKANLIQAISHYLAGFARSMQYKGPIEVIPNGVDVKLFSRKISSEKLESMKRKLKKKKKEKYVITVSRLVKKNAVDDIIKSLMHLPEYIKLLIIGEGPDAEKLWKLAGELGVVKRILFISRHVPHKELVLYLRASDVFVRPSLSEGMGNVFIEAMAAGIPVVATPVGGIPDFLADGSTNIGKALPTGLFCNVRDPRNLAGKVSELLGNKELRERIILNARALVTEKYDWSKIARDMESKIFNKILKGNP